MISHWKEQINVANASATTARDGRDRSGKDGFNVLNHKLNIRKDERQAQFAGYKILFAFKPDCFASHLMAQQAYV